MSISNKLEGLDTSFDLQDVGHLQYQEVRKAFTQMLSW